MTKLVWDYLDERLYETGIDRGVLYLPNPSGVYDNGVAWSGLTNVVEDFSDDATQPAYFDGVKYLDHYYNGDYHATLSAFTYPDEFWAFEGVDAIGDGLYVDDQATNVFSLSYRTLIGTAATDLSHGYKIHILYNLMATPSDLNYQNGSNLPQPLSFQWSLRGVPEDAPTWRPTVHIILDSRYLKEEILKAFEDMLYGDADSAPHLPSLADLIEIVLGWSAKVIDPKPTTGLSLLVPGIGDLTETILDGVYYALPTTRLVETTTPGINVLVS